MWFDLDSPIVKFLHELHHGLLFSAGFFLLFHFFTFYFILRNKSEKKAGREELMKIFGPIFDPKIIIFFANIIGKNTSPQAAAKIGGTKTVSIKPPLPPINIKKFVEGISAKKKIFWKIYGFSIQKIIFLEIPSNKFFYIYRG